MPDQTKTAKAGQKMQPQGPGLDMDDFRHHMGQRELEFMLLEKVNREQAAQLKEQQDEITKLQAALTAKNKKS